MVNISNVIFRVTGVMPSKRVVKTCKNIGFTLANEAKDGKAITNERVGELLSDSIGKKKAMKIIISDKFEDLERYMKSIGINDECLIKAVYSGTASTVLSNPKDKSVLLSLRLQGYNLKESLNLITHELEHALNQSLSFKVKFQLLCARLFGKKYLEKIINKYGQLLNEKNMDLQSSLLYMSKLYGDKGCAIGTSTTQPLSVQGLVKHLGFFNESALAQNLRTQITSLLVNNFKTDNKILAMCKFMLRDESRAYKSGGAVERYWNKINGVNDANANGSEMIALLYDEALKQVKKENKDLRIRRLKAFFGFKSK